MDGGSLQAGRTTATQTATYLALCACSLVVGYYLGVGRSLLDYNRQSRRRLRRDAAREAGEKDGESSDVDQEQDDEEDEEEADLTDRPEQMNAIRAGLLEECKLVLVVRTDLKMDKGKIAAQCGHATLACYKATLQAQPQLVRQWERVGQAKVALKCPGGEAELDQLERKAKSVGLVARSIRDAGRTQVAAGSKTVLGIGPGPVSLVDKVTGHLKLL